MRAHYYFQVLKNLRVADPVPSYAVSESTPTSSTSRISSTELSTDPFHLAAARSQSRAENFPPPTKILGSPKKKRFAAYVVTRGRQLGIFSDWFVPCAYEPTHIDKDAYVGYSAMLL
jgi:hypothetical protein